MRCLSAAVDLLLHDALEQLAGGATGGREDNCKQLYRVSKRVSDVVLLWRCTDLEAEGEREASAEDGDAAEQVRGGEHARECA